MRIEDIRLPQLSAQASAWDRDLYRALWDHLRVVNGRLAALEETLGNVQRRPADYITPGYIELTERTSAPSAPVTNRVRIYAIDNGGKTELNARFATGAIQQMEIEP